MAHPAEYRSAATAYPIRALRAAVVVPGSFVEGVLAVLLPWSVTQAALGTAWLGMASALIVAAAIVGNLLAPPASRWAGPRRMTVAAAFAAVLCLAGATVLWLLGFTLSAFGLVLTALVADGMADVGFSARVPLIARLCRQPLVGFSGANWLWGIVGVVFGSLCAGWGIEAGWVTLLLLASSAISLVVAIALAALLPRDGRRPPGPAPGLKSLFAAGPWPPQVVIVVSLTVCLNFVFGPLDNLLVPAHLTSHQRSADVFGALIAAGGMGLAAGLVLVQTEHAQPATRQFMLILLGLVGAVLQVGLVGWLPETWVLTLGILLTSAMLAPLLPLLESLMLLAVAAPMRTLFLALVGSLGSAADVAGTAAFGWVVSQAGTDIALAACTFMMLPMPVLVLLFRKRWRVRTSR
ncbi:hypothetical protein OOT46_16585 [Aquabacterium sp. A7-Y]|uniref:hypothetical protein n=1 Tax=Aquabacterium sp. A7-Y TaxID=1349605 RepID=UPI00223CC514|nr:hypothetical protein [Aquabacterium sp. A7-Y]MCW7539460.1 hypothetical protein [Aquabacterium sp. A7-Y]